MKKKLSGILGIIISIVVLVYFETFVYKVINMIGINMSNYSSMIKLIIDLFIKGIMCFIIYYIYKKDLKNRRRCNDNILKVLLVFVVSLLSIVMGMYLFSYVVKYIADIFNVSVLEQEFYNIFNSSVNINIVIKIIVDYIMMPFLYCGVVLLSVDRLANRNNTVIILSGVLAGIINALTLSGTLAFVIVNSLNIFLLFSILAFIYKKQNSIYFVITLYSFYLMSNIFILNYIGW